MPALQRTVEQVRSIDVAIFEATHFGKRAGIVDWKS
jgi:hypothetical protein